MPPIQEFKNYINGEWVKSRLGNSFENHNPANHQEVLGIFPKSNAFDVEQAVLAAREAYKHWRLMPAPRRAEILFKAAEILVRRKEEYAQQMTREMGKILKETRGDVQEAIDMTYFTAGEGRRLYGETTPAELPNKFAMSVRMPVGVCALITPWNFPMAIPSWKLIPALICGNTVVLKPARETPQSSHNLVRVLEEAGIPKGVVNLVHGSGSEAGTIMVSHPGVNLVSFTGSTETGKLISSAAAADFKRCNLEMGGKNVIMVMEDANLDLAVEGALWGGFGTTGQRCTAASRVVVHKTVYDQFINRFVSRAKLLRVGDGMKPDTDMGPVVNQQQLHTVIRYVEIGKKEGAKLLCGGHPLDQGLYALGYFHDPTIFGDVNPKMKIAQEEIFGPVVAVIPCDSFEQAIEIANDVPYGLSASIYTENVNHAFIAMRDMYTGIFYVNASTIGAEVHLPFGGTKQTGNGHREAGVQALDIFSEWKAIYVDYSGKMQKAQIDHE